MNTSAQRFLLLRHIRRGFAQKAGGGGFLWILSMHHEINVYAVRNSVGARI
jgi:hypothetical protein